MSEYDAARTRRADPSEVVASARRLPLRIEGPPVTVWVISPELTEVVVHYSGVRTFGCFLVHGCGRCPGCVGRWPRYQQWWLSVSTAARSDWPVEVVALTKVAVQSCPELLAEDGSLWGRRLTLWRHPGLVTDPMYATLDSSETPKDLPRAEPTLHTLIRLWQAKTRGETLVKAGLAEGAAPVSERQRPSGPGPAGA